MTDNHELIAHYLDKHKRDYLTPDFGFADYTPPNTMMRISDELPELLLDLSPAAMKVYLRTLTLLKRNRDPILACTVVMHHDDYKDVLSPRSFSRGKAECLARGLLLPTESRDLVIVDIVHANKLYKPKLDIE